MKRWYAVGLVIFLYILFKYILPMVLFALLLVPSHLPQGWTVAQPTPNLPPELHAVLRGKPRPQRVLQRDFTDGQTGHAQLIVVYYKDMYQVSLPFLYGELTRKDTGHAVLPLVPIGNVAFSKANNPQQWQIVWHRCNLLGYVQFPKTVDEQSVLTYAQYVDWYLEWLGSC